MPWRLIHYEAYRNEDDAKRREKYLKTSQGSRLLKRMLKEYFYSQVVKIQVAAAGGKKSNTRISTTWYSQKQKWPNSKK